MDQDGSRVPMKMGDFSVIDSEFNNIRERCHSMIVGSKAWLCKKIVLPRGWFLISSLSLWGSFLFSRVNEKSQQWLMALFILYSGVFLFLRLLLPSFYTAGCGLEEEWVFFPQDWIQTFSHQELVAHLLSLSAGKGVILQLLWIRTPLMHTGALVCKNHELMYKIAKTSRGKASFKMRKEIAMKMMEVMTKVPVAGLTLRWRGWRRRWTSSGASWSTGSPPPSARPAQGTSKTSRLLKTMINSKSLLSSIWEASNSKTVHSSSESRTIVDGKEVEGSKTSYSARFLSVCSLKLFFQSCFWSKGRGRHSYVCLGNRKCKFVRMCDILPMNLVYTSDPKRQYISAL